MIEPTEEAIARVMRQTGMGYIQARNHLIQRYQLQSNHKCTRCDSYQVDSSD